MCVVGRALRVGSVTAFVTSLCLLHLLYSVTSAVFAVATLPACVGCADGTVKPCPGPLTSPGAKSLFPSLGFRGVSQAQHIAPFSVRCTLVAA